MMRRASILLLVAFGVLVVGAADACAQGGGGWSGPGFYINPFKLFTSLAIFLIWVGTSDWVSRDLMTTKLDYLMWNPIVVGVFLVAFVGHWFIPIFWGGLALILVAWVAPLCAYILYRNNLVEQHQRVMTSEHIRHWMATRLSGSGVTMDAEKRDRHDVGVPITLGALGPNQRDTAARQLAARQNPGMFPARKVVADALYRRADAIMLDYSQQGVACNFLIDGLWQKGEGLDRETGDPMLEAIKLMAGLNPQDRQGRQQGKFIANYSVFKKSVFAVVDRAKDEFRKRATVELTKEMAGTEGVNPAEIEMRVKLAVEERVRRRFQSPIGIWTPVEKTDLSKLRGTERINPETALEGMKCDVAIASMGTPTGERTVLQLEIKRTRMATLEEAGMRTKMQEQLSELMHLENGFLLFSAPPANGLRTTLNLALRDADRYVREFAALEDAASPYEAVENVHLHTYNSAAGESPLSVLEAVFHSEPHVLLVRDLVNGPSAIMILEEAGRNRIIVSMVRAKDSIDAIQQVAALGATVNEVAQPLIGVFNQRLVRRLCDNCREAYTPPANVLAQLGLPAGQVQLLYRPPQQREDVCPECGGVGYMGRAAIFELMIVDDNVRGLLARGGDRNAILQAARAAGMRGLQEEGVVLVIKGVTSLPELIRVLKQ